MGEVWRGVERLRKLGVGRETNNKKKQGEEGDGAGGPKTRELASTPDNRK
jgi:hypothetical protein